MKILIVDDSRMDRLLLMKVLQKLGVENEVIQAGDGEEGLKLLSDNKQDVRLILLDWQMPKIDGLEFMRGVAKVPEVATIPIIMITASSSEESQRQAREVNPHLAGYLVKPYKSEVLFEMVKQNLA